MANMLVCLVLLLGVLLPAFDASAGCEHKCCHTKKSSAQVCCQVVPAQAAVRAPHGVRLCAIGESDGFQMYRETFAGALWAASSVYSPPRSRFRVLRI